jgi:hypothetical protein
MYSQLPTPGGITLSNLDSNQPIFISEFPGERKLAPVSFTFVQVLGGPARDSLNVLRSEHGDTVFPLLAPGFFDVGWGVVPGVNRFETGYFQIRAWHGDTTWEAAVTNPRGYIGMTEIFQNRTGAGEPTAGAAPLENGPSFTIMAIPEPPVALFILSGLGAFSLRKLRLTFPPTTIK